MPDTGLSGASRSPLQLLARLRWVAVLGQAVTIAWVTGPMGVALAPAPLWAGVAALAVFNSYATLRAASVREARPGEIFAHLCVDIAVLAWLVANSGGLENPFASLFLLPIALAIFALPTGGVWATALVSTLGFALAVWSGAPLPHVHGAIDGTFSLHKVGMGVNFVVSAAVLLVFFARLAALWRAREREVAALRERFARNEGIVALATHAASVAHELNTPLATMTLMVDEMPASEDRTTLRALIDQCRDRVRALAAPAQDDASAVALEDVIENWRLVRPTIELQREGAGQARVDAAVGHLLQALLNNAADASEAAGTPRVDLRLQSRGGELSGEIRDYGPGFDSAAPPLPGTLFRTNKAGGLGIGLALSHATVERLGGELAMNAVDAGRGVRVTFRLPLTVKT
ncbi:MAG TPA: ATP-binding protein [Steroidobacteraceae bacterium]|nr:ATP-binding protein [Steroidobacteraceae bacterium]